MIKNALHAVIAGGTLNVEMAEETMGKIMAGEATAAQIAGLLTALRMRGETVEEIAGFAKAMRRYALRVDTGIPNVVDTCGTGGDGANTFNISTTASFVAAAAGAKIAKHGNRSVSSKSGSADVLQAVGVNIDITAEQAKQCLHEVGLSFLFAPHYHQSMKHAMPTRKELGFRTVFNILGPLTNPAGAKRQVIGTFSSELVDKMAHTLASLGAEHALVVHGEDGLDELSVAAPTKIAEVRNGKVESVYVLTPEEVGLTRCSPEELKGGDAAENAAILEEILNGQTGAKRDIVVLNAAATLYVAGEADSIADGVVQAQEAIDSGRALALLKKLVEVTRQMTHEKETA